MNYRDPELQDRLAADYVAGGLRAGARRRFMRLMDADPALRQRVREWEERLLPLARALPPEPPPEHVWRAIAARIRPWAERPAEMPAGRRLMRWLGLPWRLRALVAGAIAVAALLTVLAWPPSMPPDGLRTLAVLSADKAPALLVLNRLPDSRLAAQPMQDLAQLAGSGDLELWAITPGQAPRSLGRLAPGQITLLAPSRPPVRGDTVAVSQEPRGGSPTGAPTGPVVLSGTVL